MMISCGRNDGFMYQLVSLLYLHSALLKTTLRDIGHLYKELHYYYFYFYYYLVCLKNKHNCNMLYSLSLSLSLSFFFSPHFH